VSGNSFQSLFSGDTFGVKLNHVQPQNQQAMKTKTVTIFFIAILLIAGTTKTSAQGFSLGFKAGASFSYLSHFDNQEGLLKRSPHIMVGGGLIGNVGFSELLSLQLEVLYEQKGEDYKMTFMDITEKVKLSMDYLTLPILLEFSHDFGNFRLFGGLGPYVGYAISGQEKTSDTTITLKFGKNEGEFGRFDVGALVNLGGGIKVGKGRIFLDLRYNYGFMDIQQLSTKPEKYESHCNRNFVASIGYIIPLGK
jgi:hypothetical protein